MRNPINILFNFSFFNFNKIQAFFELGTKDFLMIRKLTTVFPIISILLGIAMGVPKSSPSSKETLIIIIFIFLFSYFWILLISSYLFTSLIDDKANYIMLRHQYSNNSQFYISWLFSQLYIIVTLLTPLTLILFISMISQMSIEIVLLIISGLNLGVCCFILTYITLLQLNKTIRITKKLVYYDLFIIIMINFNIWFKLYQIFAVDDPHIIFELIFLVSSIATLILCLYIMSNLFCKLMEGDVGETDVIDLTDLPSVSAEFNEDEEIHQLIKIRSIKINSINENNKDKHNKDKQNKDKQILVANNSNGTRFYKFLLLNQIYPNTNKFMLILIIILNSLVFMITIYYTNFGDAFKLINMFTIIFFTHSIISN
ncbi:MAG: hypothetical protein OEZ01_16995, partial [Candidatus Heimdallarchaeota archaeon]|nr:hypothetical protein [Candidatus Heimdallarchaeota archaeon]